MEVFFVYRKRIFKRIFHSVRWTRIFCLMETVFSHLVFCFLKMETLTEVSGNKFIWERLCSTQWKLLFRASFLQVKPLLELVETSSLYFL